VRVIRDGWKDRYWQTSQGREVRGWLLAWGAVSRYRRESGDSAGVPSFGGNGAGRSGGGSSGDVTGSLLRFAEVDRIVSRRLTMSQRDLLYFCYAEGQDSECYEVEYRFEDGSVTALAPDAPEPVVPIAERSYRHRDVDSYDLADFHPGYSLKLVLADWGASHIAFLEGVHVRAARLVAGELGLK
jgi:hypothetical protein